MPATGQHRKPHGPFRLTRRNRLDHPARMTPLTRVCVAAGTGVAALAVPMAFAGHAAAAEPAAVEHYTVVHGDTLSGIATQHHVPGGWHRVYHDNEKVIGADPNVIRPGQHLVLNHSAVGKATAAATPAAEPAAAKPAAAQPAVKAATLAKVAVDSGWTKPVGNAAIGTPYHQAGAHWASGYHTGVDFLVGTGTPVHSVAAGTVVHAGPDGAYGNDVVVRHVDGRYTLYGHLSRVEVSVGQQVTEGEQVALSGATGNVTGPHLHFEVRTTPNYGSDIDPVAYLRSHGVSI